MADPGYILRDGSRTDHAGWRARQADPAYVRLADDHLPNGLWVSTIWTGLDADKGPFETVVFNGPDERTLDRRIYAAEAEAVVGHTTMVAHWANE